MNYGIPYMGSKSYICKNICGLFPNARNFYDLFGGGFSITHFMIKHRQNDYKQFHFNEIRPGICDLIKDAIAGKYNYKVFKPKWISREEFEQKKDSDPYIKMFWSFGNKGKDYLFGKDIESYKKSLHNAIIFNEFDDIAQNVLGINHFRDEYSIKDRRLFLRNKILANCNFSREKTELQRLQQLERLEQLQQIQQLEQLQRLDFYNTSYEKIKIKENSVIYCDIPYKGTESYDKNKSFDHKLFFDWAHQQDNPVFISEYNIKDNRFKEIYNIKKRSLLSPDSRDLKTERLYVNKAGLQVIFKGGLIGKIRT